MKPCLEKWFSEAGINVNLYEVHCKNSMNDKQFKEFMDDEEFAVCLSVAMLAEGVHGIDGVILLRDTISPNLYYQQIGRAFSVDMRSVPIIFDLVANCESIMDCNLKNDLLEVIDKRENSNISEFDGNAKKKEKEITKRDIESFFVYDQVLDAVNAFRDFEKKFNASWDKMYRLLYIFKFLSPQKPYFTGFCGFLSWCFSWFDTQLTLFFILRTLQPKR